MLFLFWTESFVLARVSYCMRARPRGVAAARPARSPESAFTQVPVISSARPHLSVGLLYIAPCLLILHPLGRSKKLWHLEEIGGKSNLRSLGPSRSHAAHRRDSGIIWTRNFFTAKTAQLWIFLVSSPPGLMGERRACAPLARDISRLPRRLYDGPQLRALGVPHHMFPPRITSCHRITGTRA